MEEQPEISITEHQTYTVEAAVPGEKKSRTGLIIGIIVGVLLLLCCCCLVIVAVVLLSQEDVLQSIFGGLLPFFALI